MYREDRVSVRSLAHDCMNYEAEIMQHNLLLLTDMGEHCSFMMSLLMEFVVSPPLSKSPT